MGLVLKDCFSAEEEVAGASDVGLIASDEAEMVINLFNQPCILLDWTS